MGISELEKVIRETSGKQDFHSIEESNLAPEFSEAVRTLTSRSGKKASAFSLLSPNIAMWA